METLNDSDYDWLVSVENRLIQMRKRESANRNLLVDDITSSLKHIDWLRGILGARLGRDTASRV